MINSFDANLYHLINQKWTSETLDPFMVFLSDKYSWILLYAFFLFLFIYEYRKKSYVPILLLILSVTAADRFTSGLMKPLFARVRPCHLAELTPRHIDGVYCSDTGSMASSHAANHFAIAVFLIFASYSVSLNKWNKWTLVVWAALVCYSRVYLGVHFPTDVIVGAVIGALIGYAASRINKYLTKNDPVYILPAVQSKLKSTQIKA